MRTKVLSCQLHKICSKNLHVWNFQVKDGFLYVCPLVKNFNPRTCMYKYTGQVLRTLVVHSYVWYPADDTLLGFLSLFLTDSVRFWVCCPTTVTVTHRYSYTLSNCIVIQLMEPWILLSEGKRLGVSWFPAWIWNTSARSPLTNWSVRSARISVWTWIRLRCFAMNFTGRSCLKTLQLDQSTLLFRTLE